MGQGIRVMEHRSGVSVSRAQNGALVCGWCGRFLYLGEWGLLPTDCAGWCRKAAEDARRQRAAARTARGARTHAGGGLPPGRPARVDVDQVEGVANLVGKASRGSRTVARS